MTNAMVKMMGVIFTIGYNPYIYSLNSKELNAFLIN